MPVVVGIGTKRLIFWFRKCPLNVIVKIAEMFPYLSFLPQNKYELKKQPKKRTKSAPGILTIVYSIIVVEYTIFVELTGGGVLCSKHGVHNCRRA